MIVSKTLSKSPDEFVDSFLIFKWRVLCVKFLKILWKFKRKDLSSWKDRFKSLSIQLLLTLHRPMKEQGNWLRFCVTLVWSLPNLGLVRLKFKNIGFRLGVYPPNPNKCYTLANFDVSEDGWLKEFTSIVQKPLSDKICKTFLKGYTKNQSKDFVSTYTGTEEVRNDL